jgi:hypothetical protein
MNHETERSKSGSTLVFFGAVWLLGTLVASYFEPEIDDALWIMSLLVWGAIWFAGLLLAALAFLGLRERKGGKSEVIALLLTLPMLALIGFQGSAWLSPVRLKYVEIPRNYAPRLRTILAAPPDQQAAMRSQQLRIESTSSPSSPRDEAKEEGRELSSGEMKVRVAFVEPGGILGNWSAIVYDPSDLVGKLDSPEARKCFGGDLIDVTSLGGHWYRCVFT